MNNNDPAPGVSFADQREDAREFPLMVMLSMVYPCNFGCPNCPYTDGNSAIRQFYRERGGDLLPEALWNKIAREAGPYGAWLRCTGGGEPMLHPRMTEMIELAKEQGARIWLNTNGSLLGPFPKHRDRLRRIVAAGIDMIEFSMDAGDAETYARVRPPVSGRTRDPERWFNRHVDNIRAALELRDRLRRPTRVVVSIICQQAVAGKLDEYVRFYREEVGVDEVITRKFLSWDDNTRIDLAESMDPHLYKDLPGGHKDPCVWPFERLNVDTLGRVALCGQDISFSTTSLFANANDVPLKEIWQGEAFNWYRKMHLAGRGEECAPCKGCSAWRAGVRSWDYGWLQVLEKADKNAGSR